MLCILEGSFGRAVLEGRFWRDSDSTITSDVEQQRLAVWPPEQPASATTKVRHVVVAKPDFTIRERTAFQQSAAPR
jgi:hypothetical protein